MRRPEPNAVALLITMLACVFLAVKPLASHHHHKLGQVVVAVVVIVCAVLFMALFLALIIRRDDRGRS